MRQAIVHAATTPSLGAAKTYGILANTYTNSAAGTTVNGDVGFLVAPTFPPGGAHASYGSDPPYFQAGIDQTNTLSALALEPCTFTWGAAVDLSLDATHGPAGIYTPGVYCSTGAMSISGPITLSGDGTFIFRAIGAFNTAAGATVNITGGASACDVFWTPSAATTLGAGTQFTGTLIDDSAVTVGAGTNWLGRVLAFNGPVTTATTTITVPTCTPPPATLRVIKNVVNNNGGIAAAADFNLHVTQANSDVSGSPSAGEGTPGTLYSLEAGTYHVNEDPNLTYAQSFSGDCDPSGEIVLVADEDFTCTITNNDIPLVPPLITILKVPTPLLLPAGGGSVTYDYEVTNTGTVAMNNITVDDDTCAPVGFIAGDTDSDSLLDTTETWSYSCIDNLIQTTTNIATATGQANGFTATDTASATVVVGVALPPPLIHVQKQPSAFVVSPEDDVTYIYTLTNPGTVALDNVSVVDDTCSPVTGFSGDDNSNAMLDVSETWTYTCHMSLTATTTNIAVAEGSASGLMATDTAIVTVAIVSPPPNATTPDPVIPSQNQAIPGFPNAGFAFDSGNVIWKIMALGWFLIIFIVGYMVLKK